MAGRPRRRARLEEVGELVTVDRDRHGPSCLCKRCRGLRGAEDGVPFAQGNRASERHGAYSTRLADDPRVVELAALIRESAPWISATDEVTVGLLAVTLSRVERATAAIRAADQLSASPLAPYVAQDGALATLRSDLRGWIREAARLAGSLGLDPLSRSRLGLDVARTRRALTVVELHRAAEADG